MQQMMFQTNPSKFDDFIQFSKSNHVYATDIK